MIKDTCSYFLSQTEKEAHTFSPWTVQEEKEDKSIKDSTTTKKDSDARNEHQAAAPSYENRLEKDPDPKDMTIEELSKIVGEQQQQQKPKEE